MKKNRTITLNENQLATVINMSFDMFGSKPKKHVNESGLFDEFKFLGESEEDEQDDRAEEPESHVDKVTDEQLRIDALKIAVKLSRLMNKVTAEDMLEISTKVASYLKNHQVGTEYVPDEESMPMEDESENPEDNEVADETDVESDDNGDEIEDVEMDDTPEEFTIDDEDEEESADESSMDVPEEFVI